MVCGADVCISCFGVIYSLSVLLIYVFNILLLHIIIKLNILRVLRCVLVLVCLFW